MDLTDAKYLVKHCREIITQSTSNKEKDEWFYFIHIPKTAGTSMRYMLYNEFRANEIYPNNVDFYFRNGGKYVSMKDFKSHHKKYVNKKIILLMGHFRIFPINNCKDSIPKTFTFFRDPVSRIISSVNYHRKKGRRYGNLTEDEIILKVEKNESQLMAKTFGYDSSKKNLQETLDRISELDAIGITEYMDCSIQNINRTFGWNLLNKDHRNKSTNKSKKENRILNKIESMKMIDVIVYDHALNVFRNQCRKNKIIVD